MKFRLNTLNNQCLALSVNYVESAQKMRHLYFITIFIGAMLTANIYSQSVNIGLFNEHSLKSLVMMPVTGEYSLIADGHRIHTCQNGNMIYASLKGDSIQLISNKKTLGTFVAVMLMPTSDSCILSIKPSWPALPRRTYDDGISLKVQWKRIRIINHVDIEKYVAGVVQSEGGSRAHVEYYKTQAVLCRTYLMQNINKHGDEGFNLCDGVHCQAYLNRADKSIAIVEATFATKNIVAVDINRDLILAVFHSNCGGVTENSENVWPQTKTYLRSVNDPYCQNQRNSKWEKSIPIDKWKEYLGNNGFTDLDHDPSYFNLIQYERKTHYKIKNDSIALKKIRSDWALRSTYFSIQAIGGRLVINGKGYGHGVGMCQEGAMQMAKLGYSFSDILNLYYKEISLTDYHKLEGIGELFRNK